MANATGIPITRKMMNAQDTNNIGHASEMGGGCVCHSPPPDLTALLILMIVEIRSRAPPTGRLSVTQE